MHDEKIYSGPRRGLSRLEAAHYIGTSASLFDAMVADKRMPAPRCVNSRRIWDIRELDSAFDALPHQGESSGPGNPWDG